jgi:hypothetical protein
MVSGYATEYNIINATFLKNISICCNIKSNKKLRKNLNFYGKPILLSK